MIRTKPGQEANLTDQAGPVSTATVSDTVKSGSTSTAAIDEPYKPAVGDEVEFEYKGKTLKAIAYMENSMGLCVMDNTCGETGGGGYNRTIRNYPDIVFRKIGEVDMPEIHRYQDGRTFAKAYFSAPTFRAGDEVVIARKHDGPICWVSDMDAYIGKTMKIHSISGYSAIMESSSFVFPLVSLELVKAPVFKDSYEERQAQWIKHYGIRTGNKVKLTRKFKCGEDDWDSGSDWEDNLDKYIGRELEVVGINTREIKLKTDGYCDFDYFPYFALEPVK